MCAEGIKYRKSALSGHLGIVATIILSAASLFSQDAGLSDSCNIIRSEQLRTYHFAKEGIGAITVSEDSLGQSSIINFETYKQPENIYNLSSRIPIQKVKVDKGQVLLLSFEARSISSSLETGEARCRWVFDPSDNRDHRIIKTTSISSIWTEYFVPVEITGQAEKNDLHLAAQFGFPPQSFQVRNLSLRIFPSGTDINDLPRTRLTYAGMHPDAEWRQRAFQRIEDHRKGDFELRFHNNKKPVKNLVVQVKLKQHAFSWGAAFRAKDITTNPELVDQFARAFNLAVFENDLKIKFWNKPHNKRNVAESIQILKSRDIDVKGHVLIWPGFRHLTEDFKKHEGDAQKVTSLMEHHIEDVLSATRGKISSWDVVNEAYSNTDLQRITGNEEVLYKGFRTLHAYDPSVMRFVNEYGIISRGGLNTKKQQWYFDYIKRIDEATGGLVDGIGIQCHIGSQLTAPEKVLEILDFYALLDKNISISEFTLDIDDVELRTAYTMDFMIAAFSHPSVSEFLFWGFQGPRTDIFTSDWQHGAMGQGYFALVKNLWNTDLALKTDVNGRISGRGFYGTYDYMYLDDNRVVTGEFELLPNGPVVIDIKL